MGIKLNAEQRRRVAAIRAQQRKDAPAPIAGMAEGFIPGEPPTVTHHDKKLVMRGGVAKRRPAMIDSPALAAACAHYLAKMPQRDGPPVAGPLRLLLAFLWLDPKAARPVWRQLKPDADNAAKVVTDILAKRGWIDNDAHVADLTVLKIGIPPAWAAGVIPGVCVQLETLDFGPDLLLPGLPFHKFHFTPQLPKETDADQAKA